MLVWAALGLALLIIWLAYEPGTGGRLQLDDRSNLGGLVSISDRDTALDFIASGSAGPLGRPLALASFALQADAWPDGTVELIRTNILIHLLNALLLAGCLYLLARQARVPRERCFAVAVTAMFIWATLPLLASSTLLIVQRMTTLSASFVLAGLAAYLLARRRVESSPDAALAMMTLSLGAGTALAALTKESGLLLPVYILVLELTLLTPPERLRQAGWRAWSALCLMLPLILIVAYLAYRFDYSDAVIARRGFDATERLLTQAGLLWQYLYTALVGLPGTLGIARTPPEVVRSLWQPGTLIAAIAWISLITAAVVWRRRLRWGSFAVLWFVAGHLIESTVVPLEMRFEHRNYLPVIGPVLALVVAVFALREKQRRVGLALLALLTAFSVFNLYQFTSLWGEPARATAFWAERYPDSVRAVTQLASAQLDAGDAAATLRTLQNFVAEHPEHGYLELQVLNIACLLDPATDRQAAAARIAAELGVVSFTYTAGSMLSQLSNTVRQGRCAGLDNGATRHLAAALRSNPAYRDDPLYNQFHHKLLASIARSEGDTDETLFHLEQAIAQRADAELVSMQILTLVDAGDAEAATAAIRAARADAPRHPLRRWRWMRDLDALQRYIDERQRSTPATNSPDSESEPQ